MRKRSHRQPRIVSKMISPAQHQDLMLQPRMHMELLLAGVGQRIHATYVVSAFNLGTVLAHRVANVALEDKFRQALDVLFELLKTPEPLRIPDHQREIVTSAFNALDRYLGIQQAAHLMRAIDELEHALATREGAHVVELPLPPALPGDGVTE